MRAVRDNAETPANVEPPISACLYHRCKDHLRVPAINDSETDGAECGACIAEEVRFLEETLLDVLEILGARLQASAIRKVHLQRCIDRLNFLQPGAGDQMLDELGQDFQRITLKRQWIDGRYDPELRKRWTDLPADHPLHQMALAIEKEIWNEGAKTDGGPADGADRGLREVGGQAVSGESEADPVGRPEERDE